jgi:hypothetical protein
MHCAICGHAILSATELVVSTTTSELVHIDCADREAGRAYRWRTCRAAASAGITIALLALAARAHGSDFVLLALLLILAAAHVHLNARWWRVTVLSRRRRWR